MIRTGNGETVCIGQKTKSSGGEHEDRGFHGSSFPIE
jgi:hypothetical protein